MDDTISRQAAINSIQCAGKIGKLTCIDILKRLPSAEPKRKKGKWIYGEDKYGTDGYYCNKCGFFVMWDYSHKLINYIDDYKFCPNCGKEMENGNE